MSVMFLCNDHDPAHFHVVAADFSANIALADLSLLEVEAQMRSRDLRRLPERAAVHRGELWDNWLRARRKEPLSRIGS